MDGGYLEPFADIDREQICEQNRAFLESRRFQSWDDFLLEEQQTARHWDEDIIQMLKATMVESEGTIVPRISVKTANQVTNALKEFSVASADTLEIPSLLLHASLPAEFNNERLRGVASLKERLINLQAISVPDSGHELLIDNPHFVKKEIQEFISGMMESRE